MAGAGSIAPADLLAQGIRLILGKQAGGDQPADNHRPLFLFGLTTPALPDTLNELVYGLPTAPKMSGRLGDRVPVFCKLFPHVDYSTYAC